MGGVYKKLWLFCLATLLVLSVTAVVVAGRSNNRTYNDPAAAVSLSHEEFVAQSAKLAGLLDTGGLDAAFSYTEQQLAADSSFARDCHPLMHTLGHAAFETFGSFAAAQSSRGELCNSGYLHGLIESGFIGAEDIGGTARSICSGLTGTRFVEWQCAHGVGHGLMYATRRDVPKSIDYCGTLQSDFTRQACVNGLFMEFFILISHDGRTDDGRREAVLKSSCSDWPEAVRSDCYFYAPTAFLALWPNKYSAAADNCYKSKQDYIDSCISGLGMQIMKDNVSRPEIAAGFCGTVRSTYRSDCLDGAIGLYINHHASSSAAEPLCDSAFSGYKDLCLWTIGHRRNVYGI